MEYVQGTRATLGREAMGAASACTRPGPAAIEGEGGDPLTIRGMPLLKPPYGRITAINLDQGEFAGRSARELGQTFATILRWQAHILGLAVPSYRDADDKDLIIAGEAGFFTTPSGARGAMLRAYDKATGKEVGAV